MKRKEIIKHIEDNDLWIDVYIASVGNNDFNYDHIECEAIFTDNNSIKIFMPDESEYSLPVSMDKNVINQNILKNYTNKHLLSVIFFDGNTTIILDEKDGSKEKTNWVKLIAEDFIDKADVKNVEQLKDIIKSGHERMQKKINDIKNAEQA